MTPLPNPPGRSGTQAQLEAYLEQYFVKQVKVLLRGEAIKIAPTVKGIPDRLVLIPGGYMPLVELKTTRGRLAPAQSVWIERARAQGIPVYVLYGEDQVDDWVAEMRKHVDYSRAPRSADPYKHIKPLKKEA